MLQPPQTDLNPLFHKLSTIKFTQIKKKF